MNSIIGFISKFLPSRSYTEIVKSPYADHLHPEDEAISNYVNQILYKVCLEWQQKAEQDVDEFLANLESEVERYQILHCAGDRIERTEAWEVNETGLNNYVEFIIEKIQSEVRHELDTPAKLDIEGETICETVLKNLTKENICEHTNIFYQEIQPVAMETKADAIDTNKESIINDTSLPESIKHIEDKIAEKLKTHALSKTSPEQNVVERTGSGYQCALPLLRTRETKSPGSNKAKSNIQVIEEVLGFVGEALNKLNKQLSVADLNSPLKSESSETLKLEEPNPATENSNDGFSHHLKTVREEVQKIEQIEKVFLAAQSDAKQTKGDKPVEKQSPKLEDDQGTNCQSPHVRKIGTKHPSLETTRVPVEAKLGNETKRGQSETVLKPKTPKVQEITTVTDVVEDGIESATGVEGREDKLNGLPNSAGHTDILLQKSMEKWLAKRKNVKPPEVPKYVFRKPKPKSNGLFRLPIWERSITPKVAEDEPTIGECHSVITPKSHKANSVITSPIRRIKSVTPSSVVFPCNGSGFKIVTGMKAKGDGEQDFQCSESMKYEDKKNMGVTQKAYESQHKTENASEQNASFQNEEPPKTRYSFVRVNYEMVPHIDVSSSSSDIELEENKNYNVVNLPLSKSVSDIKESNLLNINNKCEINSQEIKDVCPDECDGLSSVQSSCTDLTASGATSTTDQSHKKNLDKVNAILQRARSRKSRATHPFINKELNELTAAEAHNVEKVGADIVDTARVMRNLPKINPETSKLPTETPRSHSNTRRSQSLRETGQKSKQHIKLIPESSTEFPAKKKVIEHKFKTQREVKKTESSVPVKTDIPHAPNESSPKHPRINRTPESTIETLSTTPSYPLKRSRIPVPVKVVHSGPKTPDNKTTCKPVTPPQKSERQPVCKVDTVVPCETNSALVRGMSKHTARMAKKAIPVSQPTAEEKFQQRLMKDKKKKSARKKIVTEKQGDKAIRSATEETMSMTIVQKTERKVEFNLVEIAEKLEVIKEEEHLVNIDSVCILGELSVIEEEREIITNETVVDDNYNNDWEIINLEDCQSTEYEQVDGCIGNVAEKQSNEDPEYRLSTENREVESCTGNTAGNQSHEQSNSCLSTENIQVGNCAENAAKNQANERPETSSSSSNIHILQWLYETEKEKRLYLRETVGRDSRRKTFQTRRDLFTIDENVTRARRQQHRSNNNRSMTPENPFDEIQESGHTSDSRVPCCEDVDFTNVFGNGNLLQLYLEFQREYSRLFRLEIQQNPLLQMLIHCQQQSARMPQSEPPVPSMLTITECDSTNTPADDDGVCESSGELIIDQKANGNAFIHDNSNASKKVHFQESDKGLAYYSDNCIKYERDITGIVQYLRPEHIFLHDNIGEPDISTVDAQGHCHGDANATKATVIKEPYRTSDYTSCTDIPSEDIKSDVIGLGHYLRPKYIFSEDNDDIYNVTPIDSFSEGETTLPVIEETESNIVAVNDAPIEDVSEQQLFTVPEFGKNFRYRTRRRLKELARFLSCKKGSSEDKYAKTSQLKLDGLVEGNKNCNANGSRKPHYTDTKNNGYEMAFAGKHSRHVIRIMHYQTMLWLRRTRRQG